MSAILMALGCSAAMAWQTGSASADAFEQLPWTYHGERGPARWGTLMPEFSVCETGRLQSPVAINPADTHPAPCETLRFRYRSSSLYVHNDGRALRLGYDRGSYLVIEGLSYELAELRFHVPAEHMIDGAVADAELQLVHGNNRGDIAIVAVPLRAGRRANQTLRRILEHAPSAVGESYYGRNVGFNPLFLLPTRKDYFAYIGSLTRPPCTEGVHWYVMRTALEVDSAELRRLAQLTAGSSARPVQALSGRAITKVCEP
jgi:carbonic anhydrase